MFSTLHFVLIITNKSNKNRTHTKHREHRKFSSKRDSEAI